ncbi:2-desacetyl-2-hydroxyethyl bacteriochlorophyllide A dehydrogenase [Bacillus sp. OV194]|nr:2-desacetyl-2-hydroxyethyl bacteriochlorophyllide A dehydrogenase [Bacillus sp. OV194]
MKNHVLVSEEKGKIALNEFEISDPGHDEIQVKVHASLISPGTERAFVLNMDNTSGEYPMYPGYSSSGVVIKVGQDVTDFKVGDRIACHGIGHRSIGNIRQKRAVKIPDGVSFELAAFTSLGVIALQGVRKARLELGESAMIFGLGIIGQLSLQLARLNGALPVIGVDRVQNRLELAKQCGSDFSLDSSDEHWRETLNNVTEGKGPHVVIESTGVPEVISTCFETVRDFGRVVILSSTRGNSTINFYRDVHKKAITILGAHISGNPVSDSRPGYWTWREDGTAFLNLIKHERLTLEPMITDRVHWKQVENVYRDMLSWNYNMIGTLINWD